MLRRRICSGWLSALLVEGRTGSPICPTDLLRSTTTTHIHCIDVNRTQAAFFLSAHPAFVIVESFFRAAELIGLRLLACIKAGLPFAAPELRFRFAHQAFFAAPILARAAALI